MQKILLVGGGGREHAIAWALKQANPDREIIAAPGNAGTASIARNHTVAAEDVNGLVALAQAEAVDLVVVGPEVPLALGLVDKLRTVRIPVFGPTQAAAQLEASKAFAKAFMLDCGIPTAAYAAFTTYDAAARYVEEFNRPVVVKADGLAAGKGVIVCDDVAQARAALKEILVNSAFGAAGATVIVEERLTGPELSVLAFSDGKTIQLMPPARDHKRVFDNDEGPNTGGMGAFTPEVDSALLKQIETTVLQPAVDAMAARGTPYVGVLYAGLMLTPQGPKTLEFNCRFGDPETQAILPLLETDLGEILVACVQGRLHDIDIVWKGQYGATVVAASEGYPGRYPSGLPITLTDAMDDSLVFHAGTALDEHGQLVTAGGRVLAVSATGETLDAALIKAYAGIARVQFDGMHYRRDIGRA